MQDFESELKRYQEEIDRDLLERMDQLTAIAPEPRVVDAMRYSLLAGGKRIRPVLLRATCGMIAKREGTVSDGLKMASASFAAALEMIHTYSLIHDDLPAMDNDDLRRGRPTNHKQFNEYTAILAGDALLNYAMETMLAVEAVMPERMVRATRYMVQKSGALGMVGGQQMDLDAEAQGLSLSLEQLRQLQHLKTSALIEAATVSGAILAGAEEDAINALERFGNELGLAFQIRDDLLDVEATQEELGKTPGKDAADGKVTFVTALGIEGAQVALEETTAHAKEALQKVTELGYDSQFLHDISGYLLTRKN